VSGCVLVTGANGFLGRHVCRALLTAGFAVRGTLRPGRAGDMVGVDYRAVPGLAEAPDWRPHLAGCRAVVHTAARVHKAAGRDAEERRRHILENAEATEDLARQAQEAGVTRFVFISSIGAEIATRRPPGQATPYQEGKLLAEEKLHRLQVERGLETVSLRPPMIYGPAAPGAFRRLQRALERGLPLPFATIANRRSFLYVGNLTDAVTACLLRPGIGGKVFAMSDGALHSTPDFVRMMAAAMGRPARLWPFPSPLLRSGLGLLGKGNLAEAMIGDLMIDNAPIEAALGWTPRWTTAEGLARSFSDTPS